MSTGLTAGAIAGIVVSSLAAVFCCSITFIVTINYCNCSKCRDTASGIRTTTTKVVGSTSLQLSAHPATAPAACTSAPQAPATTDIVMTACRIQTEAFVYRPLQGSDPCLYHPQEQTHVGEDSLVCNTT